VNERNQLAHHRLHIMSALRNISYCKTTQFRTGYLLALRDNINNLEYFRFQRKEVFKTIKQEADNVHATRI
jgi:hypothetical protein